MFTFAPVVTLRATSRTTSPRELPPAANSDKVQLAKPAGKVHFAVLGLSNMLNSGGSITRMQRNASCVEGVLSALRSSGAYHCSHPRTPWDMTFRVCMHTDVC